MMQKQFPIPSLHPPSLLFGCGLWVQLLFLLCLHTRHFKGLPGGSVEKNQSANAGDVSSIPGLGRSPGEGNGNPVQYSCLENPMDRGAWRAHTVHGVAKSQTQLKDYTF